MVSSRFVECQSASGGTDRIIPARPIISDADPDGALECHIVPDRQGTVRLERQFQVRREQV
jgi:hypothetical protein